jgi:glutamate N-acetyltransferase/amino-acid N-acetyltransferase
VLNLFQESTKEYKKVRSKPLSTDLRLCTPLIVSLQLCQGLAKSIAWDGEGATVLIEVQVTGARTEAEAATVAKSVVGSSLTKVL